MNKLADYLLTIGVVLIFGLIFLRDKIWGEPSNPVPSKSSIILPIIGFCLTFPISVPCIILGTIIIKLFPSNK